MGILAGMLCFPPGSSLAKQHTPKVLEGHENSVYAVAFSPNGRSGVSADESGHIRIWRIPSGRIRRRWSDTGSSSGENPVYGIAFSPDSRLVATGGWDAILRIWDTTTGRVVRALPGHSDSIASLAFAGDGIRIATGSWDHTIRIWEVGSGKLITELRGHDGPVQGVAFSSRGDLLVSGSDDKTMRVWNTISGILTDTLLGHDGAVTSVAFSKNGRLAASGSEDTTVRLWRIRGGRGKLLRVYKGHQGPVESVAISPGGRLLLSGSLDTTLRIWHTQTGELLGKLEGHTGRVFSAVFSPKGYRILSGSEDQTVRLWRVPGSRSSPPTFRMGQRPLKAAQLRQFHAEALEAFQAKERTKASDIALKSLKGRAWTVTRKNVRLYNDLAYYLLMAGKNAEAITVIRQMVKQVPADPRSWYNLGSAQWALNQREAAAQSYQRYVSLMTKAGKKSEISWRVRARIKQARKAR